jgi:hypothetical protein
MKIHNKPPAITAAIFGKQQKKVDFYVATIEKPGRTNGNHLFND